MNKTVNGAKLRVESIGDGTPILVMHGGLGLSHDYLRPYFDCLAESHTVVFYDHLGNGGSERPTDFADISFDRLVSDAAALMTQLNHDTFVLIGHSFGGFIAQEFAAAHPERLSGLVLIDTVPAFDYHPSVSGPDANMVAFGRLFSEPMSSDEDWRATWNPVVEMYFHNWDAAVGADLDSRTIYEHRAWNEGSALLGTYNTLEKLPNISVRALVMAGKHDGITPPEFGAERIADILPNAKLAVFDNSGHYPFIEEEDAFFADLKKWLAE